MHAHTGGDLAVQKVTTIVIFGHANPSQSHALFFSPSSHFLCNELACGVSASCMNGDAHAWSCDFPFLGHQELIRMQSTGGTSESLPQVLVAPAEDEEEDDIESVFLCDQCLQ